MRECFPLIESTLSVWRRLSGLLLIPVLLMGAVTQVKAQTLREAYDLAKPPGTVVAGPGESGPADILAYGRAAGDRLGRVVRSADLNGDGVEELIVASHEADEGQPVRASAGAV